MIESVEMEKESPTGRLHVAVVGPEKNGKSSLIATSRRPLLFLDYDNRREAIAGRRGVFAITFHDPNFPNQPTVVGDTLDIMTALESSLIVNQVEVQGRKLFPTGPAEAFRGIAFDSISSFAKFSMNYVLYSNKDLRREITIGSRHFYNPKSWDAWRSEQNSVEEAIFRAFALPLDVYCVFHETAEESPDSTDEKPKYTGRVSIYPPRYKSILKFFNEVWRVKLEPCADDNSAMRYLPRVHPLPDYAFDAATTMKLDPVEEPDIEKMIAKHEAKQPKAVVGLLK